MSLPFLDKYKIDHTIEQPFEPFRPIWGMKDVLECQICGLLLTEIECNTHNHMPQKENNHE